MADVEDCWRPDWPRQQEVWDAAPTRGVRAGADRRGTRTAAAALDPKWSGGRPRTISDATRRETPDRAQPTPGLNLQPHPGHGWYEAGEPARLRPTYTRPHGVRHLFGALDLASGQLVYRIRDRKRWRESLTFLKVLRARWPHQRLYLIVDNFSPHYRRQVTDWCAANDVELVFTPTYASWLNWIEAEFTALRYFTLNGSDYHSHAEQAAAIAAYIHWRNRRATPKRDFAVNSTIRQPAHSDYLNKVA